MKEFTRIERIESLVQQELAKLIIRELRDPRLGLVTISSVKIAKDLSTAKIYVLGHDEEKSKELVHILKGASGFLRHRLAEELKLRKIPELHFYYDDSLVQSLKVSNLLNQLVPEKIDRKKKNAKA